MPAGVELVGAVKTRTAQEIIEAVGAGLRHIGHNYVQEARALEPAMAGVTGVTRHFIGHLQTNKARDAVRLFDSVQTVDSVRLALVLDRECAKQGKSVDILIEINSGREEAKAGVMPEQAEALAREIAALEHVRLRGLMTMGPLLENPEDMRPYFRLTRDLFTRISAALAPERALDRLSMGMTDSWRVAVSEGSNMVRIGTMIFGPRGV